QPDAGSHTQSQTSIGRYSQMSVAGYTGIFLMGGVVGNAYAQFINHAGSNAGGGRQAATHLRHDAGEDGGLHSNVENGAVDFAAGKDFHLTGNADLPRHGDFPIGVEANAGGAL